MKTVAGIGMAIAIVAAVAASSTCSAQDGRVPFRQIERDARLSASLAPPSSAFGSSSSASGVPAGAGYVLVPPSMKTHRTASPGFFLVNGLHLGLAAFDVAMTQHCMAAHRCREGNPIMPSSVAGQVGVNAALISFGTYSSYRLKKDGARIWWLSPIVGAASHAAGVVTGVAHY